MKTSMEGFKPVDCEQLKVTTQEDREMWLDALITKCIWKNHKGEKMVLDIHSEYKDHMGTLRYRVSKPTAPAGHGIFSVRKDSVEMLELSQQAILDSSEKPKGSKGFVIGWEQKKDCKPCPYCKSTTRNIYSTGTQVCTDCCMIIG